MLRARPVLVASFDEARTLKQIGHLMPGHAQLRSFETLKLPGEAADQRGELSFAAQFRHQFRIFPRRGRQAHAPRHQPITGRVTARKIVQPVVPPVRRRRSARLRHGPKPARCGRLYRHRQRGDSRALQAAALHRPIVRAGGGRGGPRRGQIRARSPMATTATCFRARMTPIPGPPICYAGLPAPDEGEEVVLWVQNSHPITIPAGAISAGRDGRRGNPVPLERGHRAVRDAPAERVPNCCPNARWPHQVEIHAGKHLVRPRYEVDREERPRPHRACQCRARRSEVRFRHRRNCAR